MIQAARQQYGAIDVLVNNAYFPFQVGQLHELSWEELHRAIEHELMAFYNCVQACLPDMTQKRSGKIIVVSTRLADFVFYNPYDDEDVGKLRKWMALVQEFSNQRGVVWTAPTLTTKGLLPYERLTKLYDLVKQIKQVMDPNNILNPGALY